MPWGRLYPHHGAFRLRLWTPIANVVFDTDAIGVKLPILWGFDTAWNDRGNIVRGVRYTGKDAVDVVRVSFQPWAEITEKGKLARFAPQESRCPNGQCETDRQESGYSLES